MGHTAVLTSVADGFLAVDATLFQVLIRPRLRYWPSVFRDVAFLHRPGAPQLDLLTYGKESAAFKTHVYLIPKQLDVKVAILHLPPLGAVLTFFAKEHAVHVRARLKATVIGCVFTGSPTLEESSLRQGRRPKDRSDKGG